jgi:phosphoribosyl-ATP pyrophosphohydrolase
MIARLARHSNDARRRTMPLAPIDRQRREFDAAERGMIRVGPAQDARGTKSRCRPEGDSREIERLYAALGTVTPDNHPRTARLLGSSNRKVAQKVIEEAGEVALAAVKHNARNVVRESADLLYHLAVLWRRAGIGPEEIWAEMRRRAETAGIAEKLPKAPPAS